MMVLIYIVIGLIVIMIMPPLTFLVLLIALGYIVVQLARFCHAVKKGKI
jgi:hypothetical protein